MIATITVKDPAKLQTYMLETQKVAAPFGAKLLLRAKVGKTLTGGDASHGMVVIVEFPSQAHIEQWYDSNEYRPLISLREEAAVMSLISYELLS